MPWQYLLTSTVGIPVYPGTTHRFKISGTNAVGQGPFSEWFEHTTQNDVPGPCEQPVADTSQPTQIVLALPSTLYSGEHAKGLQDVQYQIEETIDKLNATNLINVTDPPNSVAIRGDPTSSGVLNVLNCTVGASRECSFKRDGRYAYQYRLRAINSVGFGPWSSAATVVSDFASLPSPVETITHTGGDQPTALGLTWTVAADANTITATYVIELRVSGSGSGRRLLSAVPCASDPDCKEFNAPASNCEQPASLLMLECSFTAEPIAANTNYDVTIYSKNAAGLIPSLANACTSSPCGSTSPSVPDAPSAFMTTDPQERSLQFSWNVPNNRGSPISSYVLSLTNETGSTKYYVLDATGKAPMSATSANCTDYPPASASSSPAEGALLVHTVGGLLPSMDFRVTFKACNSLSLSLDTDPNEACVCLKNPDGTELTNGATCTAVPGCQACTTGGSCEPAGAKPPHTTGTPDRPSEPEAVTSLSLQEQQKTAVFLRWTFPYDNEVAISKSEIIFGGDDTAGINGNTLTCYSPFGSSPSSPQCASATEANITGLRPATQYRALLRVQNTLGFSEYSPVKWFSTLPDVPDPPSITCGDLTTDLELFFNIIPPLADNGQDITEYHYQVMSSSSGNFSKTIPPASLNEIDASSSVGVNEGGAPAQPAPRFGDVVSPSTAYTVRAYASNSLGSGPWSTNVKCSTKATPKKGPPVRNPPSLPLQLVPSLWPKDPSGQKTLRPKTPPPDPSPRPLPQTHDSPPLTDPLQIPQLPATTLPGLKSRRRRRTQSHAIARDRPPSPSPAPLPHTPCCTLRVCDLPSVATVHHYHHRHRRHPVLHHLLLRGILQLQQAQSVCPQAAQEAGQRGAARTGMHNPARRHRPHHHCS